MTTLIGVFPGGPDAADAAPVPDIREIVGKETADKIAAECRRMELRFQIRNDPRSSRFFASVASLFQS